MTINLSDLRQAVADYLENKVTVLMSIVHPVNGQVINPGELFQVTVSVRNASAADGGIALTNVRYQLSVSNDNVARIRVPGNGTAIDSAGQPIDAGDEVGFFTFTPGISTPSDTDLSHLGVGEFNPPLILTGRAGSNLAGATISARIIADPDINALFPRDRLSSAATRQVIVMRIPDD